MPFLFSPHTRNAKSIDTIVERCAYLIWLQTYNGKLGLGMGKVQRGRDMGGKAEEQQSPLLRSCSSPEEPLERTGKLYLKIETHLFIFDDQYFYPIKTEF